METISSALEFLGIMAAFGLVFAVIILMLGASLECPRCKRHFARQDNGRLVLARRYVYKTVFHSDPVINSRGQIIGSTSRSEQRKYLQLDERYFYYCQQPECGYQWYEDSARETADFTEPA